MSMKRSQSRVTENEEVCGTCKWSMCDGRDWICTNPDSGYYSDWIRYADQCEECEDKE